MSHLKLPSKRDVGVKKDNRPSSAPDVASSKSSPSLVTVMGFSKEDVLFRSDKVGTVQWRDSDGAIVALLVRMKPDVWGFSRRGDYDWEEVLAIYGNPDCP